MHRFEHIKFTCAQHAKSFCLYKNTHVLAVCICWFTTYIYILLEGTDVEHSNDSATFTEVMHLFSNISTVATYNSPIVFSAKPAAPILSYRPSRTAVSVPCFQFQNKSYMMSDILELVRPRS